MDDGNSNSTGSVVPQSSPSTSQRTVAKKGKKASSRSSTDFGNTSSTNNGNNTNNNNGNSSNNGNGNGHAKKEDPKEDLLPATRRPLQLLQR
jgi:hypothetical protein